MLFYCNMRCIQEVSTFCVPGDVKAVHVLNNEVTYPFLYIRVENLYVSVMM